MSATEFEIIFYIICGAAVSGYLYSLFQKNKPE